MNVRILVLVYLLLSVVDVHGQVTGISVESVINHPYGDISYSEIENPSEYKTYKIVANTLTPSTGVIALAATEDQPFFIDYELDCFDHSLYGTHSAFLFENPEFEEYEEACFDTFLTLGIFPPCSPFESDSVLHESYLLSFETIPDLTCEFYFEDFAFVVDSDVSIPSGGDSNSVPIMQITTNGKFSLCMKIMFVDNIMDGNASFDYFCLTDVIAGCVNPDYPNFNPEATVSDMSCPYEGCTDPNACNFGNFDTNNPDLCIYPGCCDQDACNYNPDAGCLNSECIYPDCDDPYACNFNPEPDCIVNKTCIFPECGDPEACNYRVNALCDDNSLCIYLEEYEISGESIVAPNVTYSYSYPYTEGSTYEWVVPYSSFVLGQGTPEIEVEWTSPANSMIWLRETNAVSCTTSRVYFPVEIYEIEELIESVRIELFPNPVDEYLNIIIPQEWLGASVEVISADGKLMLDEEFILDDISESLDLRFFSSGVYLVTFRHPLEGDLKRTIIVN